MFVYEWSVLGLRFELLSYPMGSFILRVKDDPNVSTGQLFTCISISFVFCALSTGPIHVENKTI